MPLRTGKDYRESLRDGRDVWVFSVGPVADVTAHPATRPIVDACAEWYDRHFEKRPWLFEIPRSADDLRRMGEAIRAFAFSTGGNLTHPPSYGACIALMIRDQVRAIAAPADRVRAADAYCDSLAKTGKFITFANGSPGPVDRFRSPEESDSVRLVKETDGGVIVTGRTGLVTMVPYVDEVFIWGGGTSPKSEHRVWFSVPVAEKGVRVVCRQPAAKAASAPLTSRFDELDAQLWLDHVFIPWERVFALNFSPNCGKADPRSFDSAWLFWHLLSGWSARAEFTLGLACAVADGMRLRERPGVIDALVDLMIDVETIRASLVAAELNPEISQSGFLMPRSLHLVPGSLHAIRNRQRMSETLRNLMGQAGVLHPAPSDLADPRMAAELEQAFGGGGFTAAQRAALLQLAWDHTSSGLSEREAAFEAQASGGVRAWRARMQMWFDRSSELANDTLSVLPMDMPRVDLSSLRFGPTPLSKGR